MSFDIGLVGQAYGTSATPAVAGTSATQGLDPASGNEDAVAVDTFPAAPPPEVTAAIGSAASAYDDLAASGRQLHFGLDPTTRRLRVELQDSSGGVITTLTPSQVLDVAAGGEPR